MQYPPEVIEEVRALNDIADVVGSYVALKPHGGNLFGLCPFHREKSPSFSVNREKQIFYCFGCNAGGNVLGFIMRYENYDFLEALKFLADRVHYILPQAAADGAAAKNRARLKETLAEINRSAARFYYDRLQADSPEAANARAYLDGRHVGAKTRVKYGIGLSPPGWDALFKHLTGQGSKPGDIVKAGLALPNKTDGYYDRFRGRLMFPILDLAGKVIGFGGRQLEKDADSAKYLNSPETPLFDKGRQLYGLHLARKARLREVILVEGYMDTIALYQAGFRNAAGVLGTALTPEHTRLLKRVNCESVILLLDSDDAGTNAALRAIPILLEAGIKVRVLQVTGDAKDPDEYLRTYGAERFAALLESAQSHVAFRVGLLRKKYDLKTTEQRVAFTREAASLLSTLTSAIETDAYASEVASQTGISAEAIRAEISKSRAGQALANRLSPVRPAGRFGVLERRDEKGVNSARKGVLQLLFAYPAACRAVEGGKALTAEEMGGGVYGQMLSLAFETAKAGRALSPADVINRFETLEEQQLATGVFFRSEKYETLPDAEKALNEMIAVIKRGWYDKLLADAQASGEGALNAVNTLFEAKRNLNSLYITLTDG
ncbi:MAG: DNA primase [Clostridiales bacterium]|nr:DNA primase [Clostridiales bacterium]